MVFSTWCTRCNRELAEEPVYLHYHSHADLYTTIAQARNEGWLDGPLDQGGFPFGRNCAERVLENQGRLVDRKPTCR